VNRQERLGDYDSYTNIGNYFRSRIAEKRVVKNQREGLLNSSSDYEYGMGNDGLGNWFTDLLNVGPKIYVPGVTGAPVPEHYNLWRSYVLKRGHMVSRYPGGPMAGKWGERMADQNLWWPAPQDVWDEDEKLQAFAKQAADIANIPERLIDKAASVAGAVGAGARKTVSDTLGIPSWLFPVLLIGGGALVVRSFIPVRR
jgi:hypothetical protein